MNGGRSKSMSDYIKREDAIKEANTWSMFGNDNLESRLKALPSADVVEVVRCKHCMYNDRGWCGSQEYGTRHVEDNDFCSQGEERRKK